MSGRERVAKSCQYVLARLSYSVFVFRILYWDERRARAKLYWIDPRYRIRDTNTRYDTRAKPYWRGELVRERERSTQYRIRNTNTQYETRANRTGAGGLVLVRERAVDPIQNTEYEYTIRNPCQTVLGERGRLNTEYRIRVHDTKPVPNSTGREGGREGREGVNNTTQYDQY